MAFYYNNSSKNAWKNVFSIYYKTTAKTGQISRF